MKQVANKVISLPLERSARTIGTDDLNICEFPLTSTGRAANKGETTLAFEDVITDEGNKQRVHRKLIVSASEAFGLPTPADSDLLLVLMHLTKLRNGFADRTVHFTRYELVKFLGWAQGGKASRRIDESLNRWVNVTLNYNRAWWSRGEKKWHSKSFHILESVDLRGRGDYCDDGTSSFTWNQVILESFQANQVKKLDLDLYFRLKTPTAKQAYRYLDKHFWNSKLLEYKLKTFACEHLGLSRTYDNAQLKRKLQPAIDDLEQVGFLTPMSSSERYARLFDGQWMIRLVRKADAEAKTPEMGTPEPVGLCEELIKRRVHATAARELVDEFPEEKIREQLAFHDWLLAKGGRCRPQNPPGFLTAAIRGNYGPPAGFQNREKLPAAARPIEKRPTESAVRMPSVKEEQLQSLKRQFASLPIAERERIEGLAVQEGNRFLVETYHRKKEIGGKLWEEVRDQLVMNFLAGRETPEEAGVADVES